MDSSVMQLRKCSYLFACDILVFLVGYIDTIYLWSFAAQVW